MIEKLNTGECPKCGSEQFHHGPCGGCAENLRCSQCGTEYWFSPPFTPTVLDRNSPDNYSKDTFNLREYVALTPGP